MQFFTFTESIATLEGTVVLLLRLEEASPPTQRDPPPLVSIEATGGCIPSATGEDLLPAVHESPFRRRSDTDTSQLLRFRNNSILAGDMNAKNSVWE
jgi:hypothetical protein